MDGKAHSYKDIRNFQFDTWIQRDPKDISLVNLKSFFAKTIQTDRLLGGRKKRKKIY